jgi:ATPase subunit of ABC transporter with duplicated ATPase domains
MAENTFKISDWNDKTVLTVRNIEKGYGDKQILCDISIDIKQFDRIGLVGFKGT